MAGVGVQSVNPAIFQWLAARFQEGRIKWRTKIHPFIENNQYIFFVSGTTIEEDLSGNENLIDDSIAGWVYDSLRLSTGLADAVLTNW